MQGIPFPVSRRRGAACTAVPSRGGLEPAKPTISGPLGREDLPRWRGEWRPAERPTGPIDRGRNYVLDSRNDPPETNRRRGSAPPIRGTSPVRAPGWRPRPLPPALPSNPGAPESMALFGPVQLRCPAEPMGESKGNGPGFEAEGGQGATTSPVRVRTRVRGCQWPGRRQSPPEAVEICVGCAP